MSLAQAKTSGWGPTLRAPGRWRPVLPTCGPRGGAHRGQGAGNSLPVLF